MSRKVLLTFDIEEFDLLDACGMPTDASQRYALSEQGLAAICELADQHRIRCTFFITAEFASRVPERIRQIGAEHEIAVHGYSHGHDYDGMDERQVFRHLGAAKQYLEQLTGRQVNGFRAPRLRAPPLRVLSDLGFRYDSSLHPTIVPGRYNHWFRDRRLTREQGCMEIPISVTPWVRLPFTWAGFRLLPLEYSRICSRLTMIVDRRINIYFHSWEFVELRDRRIPYVMRKNTGERLREKLGRYIQWHQEIGNEFCCLSSLLTERE
jgi:peptidoglycan/xylan/chitin deacetylase (PgdA/CDA1 family)